MLRPHPPTLMWSSQGLGTVADRHGLARAVQCEWEAPRGCNRIVSLTNGSSRSSSMGDGLLRIRQTGTRSFAVIGEIDVSSVDALARLLDEAADHDGDLVLELHELRFTDVSGVVQLQRFAGRLTDGGRLVLRATPPTIRRTFELLELHRIPSIRIE